MKKEIQIIAAKCIVTGVSYIPSFTERGMSVVEQEAVANLRAAVEKREAGVQHDKLHHERSARAFDVEKARGFATINGLSLRDCSAVLAALTTAQAQAAEIERLRAELASRDAIASDLQALCDRQAMMLAHRKDEA